MNPDLAAVLASLRAFEEARPAIVTAGEDALLRLLPIAQNDTHQSRIVAKFLLGCYDGSQFPFDLTDLRTLDIGIFEDCIAVLRLDYRPEAELHCRVRDGAAFFEALARRFAKTETA
jgi:hypothetical protein